MRQHRRRHSAPQFGKPMSRAVPNDSRSTAALRHPPMRPPNFGKDPEISALAAGYVRAERNSARAAGSLERLVSLCSPVAAEIARSYTHQEANVADIVQNALLSLSRHLPQLREPEAFPQWFTTLVHNAAR